MSLKTKITEKLKAYAKDKGINLSNARINKYAGQLDDIVENEDGIDAEIEKLDKVIDFKDIASLDDAKRSAEKKAAEDKDKAKSENDDPDDKSGSEDKIKSGDDTPAWAKALIESNQSLQSEIASIKAGNVTKSRREQLEAKLKDAPEKFKARTLRDFDRLKIDTDEDFTEYLSDIEQDVSDEIQASSDAGLGSDKPFGSVGGKTGEKEVSPLMKSYLSNQAKANGA